jgi:hypothetical protein
MLCIDGEWRCVYCGEVTAKPEGRRPKEVFSAASGRATMRVLFVGATEIHRCAASGRKLFLPR